MESVGSRMEPGVRMAWTRCHPQETDTTPSVPVKLVSLLFVREDLQNPSPNQIVMQGE